MPGAASGLKRDINLVRRRAWLFIPFLIVGLVFAYVFRSVAGDANAVASMNLETVLHDVVAGGDRGFRIFEAQSMTKDAAFKEKVKAAVGDANFDYARYSISLSPISVADGVSTGILSVSITDSDKATAERYRQAFVDVFTQEYLAPEGLFRERFIQKKQAVVDDAEREFQAAFGAVKPLAEAKGLPPDELLRSRLTTGETVLDQLNRQEGDLRGQLAQVTAALANPAIANSGIQATLALGTTVSDTQALQALQLRQAVLVAAINEIQGRRSALSDGNLGPELVTKLDTARVGFEVKEQANFRLASAKVAIISAQSSIETSYSGSGGVAGSMLGRVAVALAVTLVFGLIAIYLWEWLSQVRANTAAEE